MPLRNLASCLPVTALAAINVESTSWIIAASGPFLKVWDLETRRCVLEQQIFSNQAIHGIVLGDENSQSNNLHSIRLLTWGGRSLSLARLSVPEAPAIENSPRLIAGIEVHHEDWVLDARIWPMNVKFAGPVSDRACLVTMGNALYSAQADTLKNEIPQIVKLGSGLRSILYSAQIKVRSPSSLLIAAGTVFGEIIVWSCFTTDSSTGPVSSQVSCKTHHVLRGHQGSIFGVSISDEVSISASSNPVRLLASCSDDRTIRVWHIGECLESPQAEGIVDRNSSLNDAVSSSTGFSLSELPSELPMPPCIVSANAHISRIWGISFWSGYAGLGEGKLQLISIGEDAFLKRWMVYLQKFESSAKIEGRIDHVTGDCFHSGKSIWSSTELAHPDGPLIVATGGADGAVVIRYSPRLTQAERPGESVDIPRYTVPFKNMFQRYSDTTHPYKSSILKNYTWLSSSCVIATRDRGQLWRGLLAVAGGADEVSHNRSHGGSEQKEFVEWQPVSSLGDLGSYPVVASSESQGLVLISDESRQLWLVREGLDIVRCLIVLKRKAASIFLIDVDPEKLPSPKSTEQIVYALLTYLGSEIADLICIYHSVGASEFKYDYVVDLQLPKTFTVTSCLFCPQSSTLILGSRAGAVAIYELTLENSHANLQHSLCRRHVHGEDAVTSLTRLPCSSTPDVYFLSCGRDGHYAVHVILRQPNEIQLTTLHRTTLPFGPNIEGAYFSLSSKDLILYGFRSKDFVVWNESAQMQVLSVECGGVHRSWAFRGDDNGQGGCFIWTQASSFHIFSQSTLTHRYLQKGGHGREIKSLAFSSSALETPLLVTGAEDTAIRFFTLECEEGKRPELHCVRIFKKHTTGIQHLQWSPCGKLILSSAGCEELFVWRISSIPGFGVGAVCEAALPKETEVSDLRITNFDICTLDAEENGGLHYLVAAAYSNSTLKVFHYNGSDATFKLEAYGLYKTNCLTQISFIPQKHVQNTHHLLSASTDGSLALWSHTTSDLEPPTPEVSELQYITRHAVHQSSIKALQTVSLSKTHLLIITGGDDNALGLTILGPNKPSNSSPLPSPTPNPISPSTSSLHFSFSSLLIPSAHTATITALSISPSTSTPVPIPTNHPSNPTSLTLLSTSTDQRIKCWHISIDVSLLETLEDGTDTERGWMDAVDVARAGEGWTGVADVGGMCLLGERSGSQGEGGVSWGRGGEGGEKGAAGGKSTRPVIAVAGVGLEVCEVDFD